LIHVCPAIVPEIFKTIPPEKPSGRKRRGGDEVPGIKAQFEPVPEAPAKSQQ
jgi:hypothetical protein